MSLYRGPAEVASDTIRVIMLCRRLIMKWTRMYLLGYIILIIGVLAALWKLKILARIGMAWTVIGVIILIGFGIMIAVSNSDKKENEEK